MNLTGPDFVRAAMRHLGMTKPTDFANRLDLGANGYRKVKRWLDGENDPDFASTIRILEECGWLNMTADGPALAESADSRLGEVLEGVTELLRGQKTVMERLKAAPRVQPKAPSGKTRTATGKK